MLPEDTELAHLIPTAAAITRAGLNDHRAWSRLEALCDDMGAGGAGHAARTVR